MNEMNIGINFGQAAETVENNVRIEQLLIQIVQPGSHGYLTMSRDELLELRAYLMQRRKASTWQLLRHHTVRWYVGTGLCFVVALLASAPFTIALALAGVVSFVTVWMTKAREHDYRGMTIINEALLDINGCLAANEAYEAYAGGNAA